MTATVGESVRTGFTTCPLCEARCGLELRIESKPDGEEITQVRGDKADPLSKGFLCPKGASLAGLHHDRDRLRQPLIRRNGTLVPSTWDEAFAEVARLFQEVHAKHGSESVRLYGGNPAGFNVGAMLLLPPLRRAIWPAAMFTAATVDQWPRNVASSCIYGDEWALPVADIERTDYVLIMGADPLVSMGSLNSSPNWKGILADLRERGGRVVVADPRRSRTADAADEWLPILPGGDAFFLLALINTLVSEKLAKPSLGVLAMTDGLADVIDLAAEFTPEAVAVRTGIEPASIRRIAQELVSAPTAVVYGRIGTTLNEFGTSASWLIDVVNILTGNFDRVGGAMFGESLSGIRGPGLDPSKPRARTHVRDLPEIMGQFPAAALAEEILDGDVRGLVVVAGNPARSLPNSDAVEAALESLDLLVCVDFYLNETTRFAHVILPPPSSVERISFDFFLSRMSMRKGAKFSPALIERDPGAPEEWEILARLITIASGGSLDTPPATVIESMVQGAVSTCASDPNHLLHERSTDEILQLLQQDSPEPFEQLLDHIIRIGPFGDMYGTREGLTLAKLREEPHGLDLGAMEPRLPEVVRTPDQRIRLAHPHLMSDARRLRAAIAPKESTIDGELLLIGRRSLRSMNSWLHNVESLTKGTRDCTLHIHPTDAEPRGLKDGEKAKVNSRVGTIEVDVMITEDIRAGVVSIPHGWGHSQETGLTRARNTGGANVNAITDELSLDPLSGTCVLNGVPVQVFAG
jgi:anaerobic selenocysteine-containing dehydrogenase